MKKRCSVSFLFCSFLSFQAYAVIPNRYVSSKYYETIPVVTDCPEYDSVEEVSCETEGKIPVPFKMMRNHGVIAIPQFEMGCEGATDTQGQQPRIMIKKFRDVDGTMQPDGSFSDDGVNELSIALPTGDCITGFTLAKDKLIIQSRPENFEEGLSRIATMDLNHTDSTGSVDSGSLSGLWVRGDLYRYHDNVLYTFSDKENRVYIYPQSAPPNPQSTASARIVDLKTVRSAGEELVSVLANEGQTYVAVRKAGMNPNEPKIDVFQVNLFGEIVFKESQTASPNAEQKYQMNLCDGKAELSAFPMINQNLVKRYCSNAKTDFFCKCQKLNFS